ncbi:MAG: von Willebrand factor type [Pelosinus sp.]|nr:von Willebrand factor type [Pelosinus sp.]
MIRNEEYLFGPQFLLKIAPVIEKLVDIFSMDVGVRIGQSTVCSQKMHSFHPETPEDVHVFQDMDAGQVFYQRVERGSIYHLDIFHQCGLVDHELVAVKVQEVIDIYNRDYELLQHSIRDNNSFVKADLIDIQTSTGGGRITGSLGFGKKLSLRKAHINHVHLTSMMSSVHLACLIYMIIAVENSILSCNLELRCNEKIKNIKGIGKQKNDLTAYIDESDSFLKGKDDQITFESSKKTEEVNDWLHHSDKSSELKEFSGKYNKKNTNKPTGGINSRRAASGFGQEGLIELEGDGVSVEEYGKIFKTYLEKQLPEIEAHLQKVVREAKNVCMQSGRSKIFKNKSSCSLGKDHLHNVEKDNEYGELAIAEIIEAAARRMVEKGDGAFKILYDDVRYFSKRKRKKIEFCLLMDASSSMEGQRIHVAKLLARYLYFSTNDRISVIVFQKNRAWVQVPFTHDYRQLEQGIDKIKAYGETPLALGITACLQYIEKEKARNPFIILITDGVPTLGTVTTNPIHDALQVAQSIKNSHYGFTCIGLKPHLCYLNQLSEVAGGSVYAVENLEETGV